MTGDLERHADRLDGSTSLFQEFERVRPVCPAEVTYHGCPAEVSAEVSAEVCPAEVWDKHSPSWRDIADNPPNLNKQLQDALAELINRFKEESTPLDPDIQIPMEDIQQLTIEKQVSLRRGKWRRFSPEIEAKSTARRSQGGPAGEKAEL